MILIFFLLALIKVVQLLLVAAFAAGHAWCLTAFFVVTCMAALLDLLLGIAIIVAYHRTERSEP